jgi:Amt family ammonium transporter
VALLLALLAIGTMGAWAQEPAAEAAPAEAVPTLDTGNTAWMLTSMVLVLFMTIPGLALFYGGLVRTKNVLSVLMQCFVITALITIVWVVIGYSLAFTNGGPWNKFAGGFEKVLMMGVDSGSISGSIPESVFMCFQLTFAIITPALIVGGFAERMKFSAVLLFMALWSVLVYSPIAHMVWGGQGAFLADLGALDFAGGTVVHINAGMAALASCLVIGKRQGFPTTAMPPHNMTMTLTGASMLWVGWFGFNAGSELAADGTAGMAMAVTQIATASAVLTWMCIEWIKHGKPSALGVATGAVAGLVAITPASGTAGFIGAIVIGFAASVCCFLGATTLKRAMGYDDALDAFGVHGIGGFVGAILTGVFATPALGGMKADYPIADLGHQVFVQLVAAGTTVVYSGIVSYVLLKIVDAIVGLRVAEPEEIEGLDVTLHNEAGYNF